MAIWKLHPLRVRYQETDQMGVVYHANYLNWFEIGRTEWVRESGICYKELEAKGLLLPVTEVEASFRQPARYDEWITVCTSVAELTGIRVHFQSRIVSGNMLDAASEDGDERVTVQCINGQYNGDEPPGQLLVRGSTRHVWINRDWKPVRLDREAPEWFAAMKALAGGDVAQ